MHRFVATVHIYNARTGKRSSPKYGPSLKGNFCVTKGVAGFTSIGPDHGIEQENRELQVISWNSRNHAE